MGDYWDALGDEVSLLGLDPAIVAHVVVRLLMAALVGGILGVERERLDKSAGLRTHMMVAVGTALFVVAADAADVGRESMGRVIQGVAAGIGFIGAGAILKVSDEQRIHGLTTASSVWITAALGVCAGLGYAGVALVAAIMAAGILVLGRQVERMIHNGSDHGGVPGDDEARPPDSP